MPKEVPSECALAAPDLAMPWDLLHITCMHLIGMPLWHGKQKLMRYTIIQLCEPRHQNRAQGIYTASPARLLEVLLLAWLLACLIARILWVHNSDLSQCSSLYHLAKVLQS